MGFLFGAPKIEGVERQQCLAYLEEERKLQLFRDKVDNLFNDKMAEYGRVGQKDMDKAHKGFVRITKQALQATTELAKRKYKMTSIPDIALPTSSAWEAVYLNYEAMAKAEAIAMETDPKGMTSQWKGVQELVKEIKKSMRRAGKEEDRLLKRLTLREDEARIILDNASRATEADPWLLEWKKLLNREK